MFTDISWLLKSRIRWPSGVYRWTPSARSIAMGSRSPWTDHEKNVWARDSRTISWLDIGSAAVRTVIGHLEAGPVSSGGTPRAITPRRPVDVSARASVATAVSYTHLRAHETRHD